MQKKFNKNFDKKKFSPSFNQSFGFKQRRTVGSIIDLKGGDYFQGLVKIMRKTQPGPVIFVVSDGYASVDAVTKESSFDVGEVVELTGQVNERAGKLQIEIDIMKKSKEEFDSKIEENSEPVAREFSIKSERYLKLKPYFHKIAKRLRRAILENQSILIRHHADADGIISGMCIEHSCKMLMEKIAHFFS